MAWFSTRRQRALALLVLALLVGALLPTRPTSPSPAAAADDDVAPGRVIVKLRDRGAAGRPTAASSYGAQSVEERPGRGSQLWRVAPGREREVARRAATRPDVEYAEPDRIVRLKLVPNDALYDGWQWNLPKVNAPEAWEITTGDSSVIVAVIDSGFDVGHPDRPVNLRLGCDYVRWGEVGIATGACPSVSDDPNGHGTHVSGIVAARQNNALGVTGLAPSVTVLAIRTADANGASYLSDVADAIREATDSGARVINLSLGGPTDIGYQRDAIAYALGRGVVIVAAAGNEYQDGNTTSYPAAYPGVIAVAAASDSDQHAWFSNTGSYVSIAAPGGSATVYNDPDPRHWITSLYPTDRGLYRRAEGTSQATPHVAAAVGLMLSARPGLTGVAASGLVKSTARPIGGPAPNETFGYGYLDVNAAVRAAQQAGVAAPSATPLPARAVEPPADGVRRTYIPAASRGAGGQ